jgi:RNA polymerase sigma factor (sigma-70 family)
VTHGVLGRSRRFSSTWGNEDLAVFPSTDRAAPPEAELTRALYEEYAGQIFRYCLHQLGSREEAEDAVQSTFLNAFRGIKRGVVPEIESAWLFKIAHNVCLSRRRSSWRRGRIESPADFELVEELAPAPSRRSDELIGLQDVLEQMPEQQRRAILLREWQGLSYREIGEELELSQAAVETLIFRGRRALAQGLEQPPAPAGRKRARFQAGGAFANLLSSAQSFLLGGGAAVKVAATVAVVSAGTVVATAPVQQHLRHQAPRHKAAPAARHVRTQPQRAHTATAPVTPAPARSTPRRHPVAVRHVVHHAAPPVVTVTPAPVVPQAPPVEQAPPPEPAVTTPAADAPAAPPAQPQPQPEAPATPTAHGGDGQQSNGKGRTDAPGQVKKDEVKKDEPEQPVPVQSATTPAPTTAMPPGQAKKVGAVAVAPELPVTIQAAPTTTAPVTTTTAPTATTPTTTTAAPPAVAPTGTVPTTTAPPVQPGTTPWQKVQPETHGNSGK